MSEPFSRTLRKHLTDSCEELSYSHHNKGVYVNTIGPRFETPREIRFYSQLGGDIVGMTNVPEVILSRERGLEYAKIATGTNYACGISENPLTYEEVSEMMKKREEQLKEILTETIKRI